MKERLMMIVFVLVIGTILTASLISVDFYTTPVIADVYLFRLDYDMNYILYDHALFFLDLATGCRILPPHQVVILDEGHRVEEAARGQFGITIGSGAVARLLEDLRPPSRRRRARRPP